MCLFVFIHLSLGRRMLGMINLSCECFNTLVAIERPYLSVCLHLNLKTWCVCNMYTSEGMVTRAEWKKDQNCKLQFPQPDYWPGHSPNFTTVFGIMIGPFSFCEIGKMWGTNKQVNKQTNKNWKFQFPQPDYQPRHSPDFRPVFGITIGPFFSCEIGKTWGT